MYWTKIMFENTTIMTKSLNDKIIEADFSLFKEGSNPP